MNRHLALVMLAVLAILPPDAVQAGTVLASGNSLNGANATLTDNLSKLGHTFTFVSPYNFGTTSLTGFNAVWMDGFSQYSPGGGNPGLVATALVDFMTAGGTVLVQNPGFGSEGLAAYPFGDELTASFTNPPGEDLIRIVDASHPLNAGLTGPLLSTWNPSAYGVFTLAGTFVILTDNGTTGQSITLVKPVGLGQLVYTQHGISQSLSAVDRLVSSGPMRLLGNILNLSPTVAWFFPTQGPAGTPVSLTGRRFTAATEVAFNGTPAAFAVTSDTSITATVPEGATSGPITVSGPDGTWDTASSFTVIPSVRGDANGDGVINVADVFYLINSLFAGGLPPVATLLGDANHDGHIDVSDVFFLINFLFAGGATPS